MNLTDAISIVEALAEGVDPLTGEALPDQSPYHKPSVIRALYTVAYHLRPSDDLSMSRVTSPANAGSPWTVAEDEQLVREFERRMSIPAIAVKHQRTRGAILARLVRLGKIASRAGSRAMADGKESGEAPRKWWKEQGRTQAGKPWTDTEDQALLQDFEAGMSIEDLAEHRRRGVKAVEVRLIKLGKRLE